MWEVHVWIVEYHGGGGDRPRMSPDDKGTVLVGPG